MTAASAQTQTVKGRVVDENNAPVIGATVVVKNRPTIGTSTDVKGEFALQGVPKGGGGKLQISYVGYKTQDVDIAPNIRVKLEPDAQAVEAVVVTGMTKMDKRLFTGAADQLVADDVKLAGMADISRGLEGRSAGVSVQNVSGTFGTAPKIRVRGATSIYGSSKPLWVVDGVIMEDIVDIDADDLSSGDATTLIASAIAGLNAEDIESFNILKDGSATSIYGARAMAGVIVITTKRGRAGVSTINYTGEFTYRMIPSYRDFNIMNSQDQMSVYMDMQKKGWLNLAETITDSESGVFGKMYQMIAAGQLQNDDASIGNYLRAAEFRNTNWFSELFNNNVMHTHSVSLTSGTDKSSYYASLSAMSDPGWTKTSKVERYTANINATYNIFKNLSLNLISNGSYRKQKAPGTLSSATNYVTGEVKREFDINPYSYALNTSRTLDPDEFYTRNYTPFNIKDELSKNYMDLNVSDVKFQAELKWKITPKVEVSALGAIKYQASSTEHHIEDSSNQAQAYRSMATSIIQSNNPYLYDNPDEPNRDKYSILPQGGIYKRSDFRAKSRDFRASISYNDTFNDKHILNLFGIVEVNAIDRRATSFQGWGLQYDMGETPFYILDLFKKQLEENTQYYSLSNTRERNAAFAGTFSYSYDYRYTINGTLRYEGSNRLGRSRKARWLPTWNIAGKWSIDQESFFEPLRPAFSSLALRLSYSLTADRGPTWVNNSTATIYPLNPWRGATEIREPALSISAPENSELTYEKKHELNVGLDMGFLDDRITLSMDAYRRNNFDLIGNVVTMGLGGAVDKQGNVAEMKSQGVELSLFTRNIERKDFKWQTNFIFAWMDNEVTKLKTMTRMIDYITGTGYSMEGTPRGSLFSLKFKGLNEMGIPTFLAADGSITSTNIQFQETVNMSNLVYEGPVDPTITGSLGNIFKWKGFTLNVFMTYSFGNVVRLDPIFSNGYSDLTAMPREFANRYLNPGDERRTNVPVIASTRQNNDISNLYVAYSAYNYSDVRVAKGDFIRMKEISLSYDFPQSVSSKLRMSGLSLKFQATNPFLIYSDKKLQGQDPEFFNTGGVAVPMPKQFTLTLRVSF